MNTLLDFARVEAGRMEASFEATDLAALTMDLASAFRSAIERAGLSFDVECVSSSKPTFVDRNMWEKIVLNLLSNASKLTFSGSIRVTLRVEGAHAELQVKDSRPGIAADQLPHVFERFHRVRDAPSRTHEGSRIGLAHSSELVGVHRGSPERRKQGRHAIDLHGADLIRFGASRSRSHSLTATRDLRGGGQ